MALTLTRVWPKTGRMHQIRVFMAAARSPGGWGQTHPNEELQLELYAPGWTPALRPGFQWDRQASRRIHHDFSEPEALP